MGWVPEGKFNINHALLLASSSVLTAALASFVLGVIMFIVILLSDRYHINPDNVATPIAASLGDLTTLALLSWISSRFYIIIGKVFVMWFWLDVTVLICLFSFDCLGSPCDTGLECILCTVMGSYSCTTSSYQIGSEWRLGSCYIGHVNLQRSRCLLLFLVR